MSISILTDTGILCLIFIKTNKFYCFEYNSVYKYMNISILIDMFIKKENNKTI